MGIFRPKKRNVTRFNRKDDYYRDYYFNKALSQGIELVAAIEHSSKKDAAELLMTAALSSYMARKVEQDIKDKDASDDFRGRLNARRFIRAVRAAAKERGVDISKLI